MFWSSCTSYNQPLTPLPPSGEAILQLRRPGKPGKGSGRPHVELHCSYSPPGDWLYVSGGPGT
jgi:hypothetical protein